MESNPGSAAPSGLVWMPAGSSVDLEVGSVDIEGRIVS